MEIYSPHSKPLQMHKHQWWMWCANQLLHWGVAQELAIPVSLFCGSLTCMSWVSAWNPLQWQGQSQRGKLSVIARLGCWPGPILSHVICNVNGGPEWTALRSPWIILLPCKYSKPRAMSSDCKLFIHYTVNNFQFVTYQQNAIGIRSLINQELYQVSIFHPRTHKTNPWWVSW
jgi:hypothetical protein